MTNWKWRTSNAGQITSRLLWSVVLSLAIPDIVVAQLVPGGGTVSLYSDAGLTNSTYQDDAINAFSIYVVHNAVTFEAAHAIRFRVEASSGITFIWLSETSPKPTVIGDSRTGIEIGYGACLIPDAGLILQIQYLGIGTSEPCSFLRVVPHPAAPSGEIEVVLCVGMGPASAVGKDLLVNCTVPVQETTWGRIKSLYR